MLGFLQALSMKPKNHWSTLNSKPPLQCLVTPLQPQFKDFQEVLQPLDNLIAQPFFFPCSKQSPLGAAGSVGCRHGGTKFCYGGVLGFSAYLQALLEMFFSVLSRLPAGLCLKNIEP